MVTVIYVYELATMTIAARDPRDERATLRRCDQQRPARVRRAVGPATLERGVYAIVSHEPLRIDVTSGRVETQALPGTDEWPDPRELAAGASEEQVRTFFRALGGGGGG